ncbi:MAG: hypothetical protein ABL997_07445, partial [Planctomycetota bacterium]
MLTGTCCFLVTLFAAALQDPSTTSLGGVDPADAAAPLASYRSESGERVVTRGDVALEMAFHLRRKDDGRAACAQLVKTALVRRAATSAGLWPDPAQLKARWDELRAQMKAA